MRKYLLGSFFSILLFGAGASAGVIDVSWCEAKDGPPDYEKCCAEADQVSTVWEKGVCYTGGSQPSANSSVNKVQPTCTNNPASCPGASAKKGKDEYDKLSDDEKLARCNEYGQAVDKCNVDSSNAIDSACNYKTNSGMQSVIGSAQTLIKQTLGLASMTGLDACSNLTKIQMAADIAFGAFKATCAASQSDCTASCAAADKMRASNNSFYAQCGEEWRPLLTEAKGKCTKASVNMNDATSHLASIMQSKNLLATCSANANAMSAYCQANPTVGICQTAAGVVNCNDAATANSNPVCICKNTGKCGDAAPGVAAGVNNASTDAGTADGSLGSGNLFPSSLTVGDESQLNSESPNIGKNGAGGLDRNGNKGSGRNIGGGGGDSPRSGGASGGGGGAGASADRGKVLNGYYGGGGGGVQFGNRGGSSGDSGGGYARQGGGGGSAQDKVDLKQFLPGGQRDPSRSLAGISGPDGITGPNSDLFQKVNVRYKSLSGTFKP